VTTRPEKTLLTPDLSGPLGGLRAMAIDDLDRWKAAVGAGKQMGFGYYFPYLLAHNKPGRTSMLISEDEGSTCVFRWEVVESGPRLDVYLPPTPLNVPALRRCLERANDFNGDRSAQVLRIDDKDAAVLSGLGDLAVRQRREQYIFAPASLENLAGNKLRNVRRHVAMVEQLPGLEVMPFSPSHAPACQALLRRWMAAHEAAHGTAGGAGIAKRAIALVGQLPEKDLSGEVVLLQGQLVAFAFGGEIRPGLGCAFERKCETEVRGLTWFHLRSLLLRLRAHELVNDGSDAGRAGLRQLKESFRPVQMHAEHRATQSRGDR
jgi:hypothetical protein